MATAKNAALHSPAVARASSVFPQPGGPYRRMPPPDLRLKRAKSDGFWKGSTMRL